MKMLFYMQHTTCRRANYIIELAEVFNKKFVASHRKVFETRIGHWLATTRLIYGVCNAGTCFLQKLQRSFSRAWIKLVNVTRYKKTHVHMALFSGDFLEFTLFFKVIWWPASGSAESANWMHRLAPSRWYRSVSIETGCAWM